MIISMTGYGRAEVSLAGMTVSAEIRSVNNRYLEFNLRTPRLLASRENEIKDLIRRQIGRGSVSLSVKLERAQNGIDSLTINKAAARSYYKLLNELRKTVKIRETVKLQHLLASSDIFESGADAELSDKEWKTVSSVIENAVTTMNVMRAQEGSELEKDLRKRATWLSASVDDVERRSKERIPEERKKLRERIAELVSQPVALHKDRLELEITLLADRLDVTEECVRFRSHIKFLLEAMKAKEPAGRKLNFLLQELNREANTIASKSNDAAIAQTMVAVKEELERMREQLQNIE